VHGRTPSVPILLFLLHLNIEALVYDVWYQEALMRGMSQTLGMHKPSVCLAINPSFDGLRPTQQCSRVQFIGVGREANTHRTQSHQPEADATSHTDLWAYLLFRLVHPPPVFETSYSWGCLRPDGTPFAKMDFQ
jgi:hypothetical protein